MLGAVLLALASVVPSVAAELKPATIAAWNQYVKKTESALHARLSPGSHFLWVDEDPNRRTSVKSGEVVVGPVGENPILIDSGLVHDWVGAVFVPGATVDDVFAVTSDYARYEDIYKPGVASSKLISTDGNHSKFSLLLRHKALFLSLALHSEYESSYVKVGDHRWYSTAYTTEIQEIKDFKKKTQSLLPPDTGGGYIWRLYSIARFEERDGGVYVELEALALTRDIPASLHWFVDPIVRRISKSSLQTSLGQTRKAVQERDRGHFQPGSGI
ncbi:MAG: hypothetical protein ABI823_10740 [Bryobacteraceae bacterium]